MYVRYLDKDFLSDVIYFHSRKCWLYGRTLRGLFRDLFSTFKERIINLFKVNLFSTP